MAATFLEGTYLIFISRPSMRTPMLRAVPAMISMAASMVLALRSGILISAISRS